MSFAAWSQKERGEYTINSGTSTKSQLAVNYPKLTVEWVPLFCLLWFDKKKINGSISLSTTLQIFPLPKHTTFYCGVKLQLAVNYQKLRVEWVPLFCLLWFNKKKINGLLLLSLSLCLQIYIFLVCYKFYSHLVVDRAWIKNLDLQVQFVL